MGVTAGRAILPHHLHPRQDATVAVLEDPKEFTYAPGHP